MLTSNIPALGVVLLLMTAYALPLLSGKGVRWVQVLPGLVLALTACFSALMLVQVTRGEPLYYAMGGWEAPWGIEIAITPLSALVIMVASALSALVILSLPKDLLGWSAKKGGWYSTLILLLNAGLLGMAMANDLFNLYVFAEVTTLAACALVAASGSGDAINASFKYLMLGGIGSGFILFAIGITYVVTGHLNLEFAAAGLEQNNISPLVYWVMSSFYLVGFAIKAGLFPLYVWLPDAHSSAPTTASALLSGVVVKVYAVAMFRIFYGLLGDSILTGLGVMNLVILLAAVSILAGSAFALVQTDIKRLLAYSTVSQIGYIFLGFGLGNVVGVTAALYHIAAHGLMKVVLFLVAGAVIKLKGSRDIGGFNGLGRQYPLPMCAFTLAALSMIGLPLLAGFATKWYLFAAGLQAGLYWVPVLVIVSGLLNAAYFLPLVGRIWFGQQQGQPAPALVVPGLPVLMAILLFIGLFPGAILELLGMAATWLIT